MKRDLGPSLSRCTCLSLEDRDRSASSNCNEDSSTLVAIENDESSKEEERFSVCSSIGENESTLGSDEEGIFLKPMEESMGTNRNLDSSGGSTITSNIEQKDIEEMIYFEKKLISALK